MSVRTGILDMLKGATAALASSLATAILLAYIFRLSIPSLGSIGPFGLLNTYKININDVLFLVYKWWIFYGLLYGGFIALFLLGAITGILTGKKHLKSDYKNEFIILWAAAIGAIPVLGLSVLNFTISP